MNLNIKKKRILFLIPSLRGGGAERVIVTLLKHFDRSIFQLALAVVDTRKAVFLDDLPTDIEVIDLGVTRVRYALPRIVALIWRRRPDVVFSTLGHLNLALSMVRSLLPERTRYIVRETSIVSKSIEAYPSPFIWRWLYRRFYKNHDRVVCQSQYMQSDLVRNFSIPLNRTIVINNPVDVKFINSLSALPFDNREMGHGCPNLVASGRLVRVKGFDLLIHAIALLENPGIRLSILGEGAVLDELKQFVLTRNLQDQIFFVGFQSNPYAWFARADAFVLSSRHEGFPNVVLEAIACGTPVIATPAPGGIHEILDEIDGCIIADKISAEALADAIGKWINTRTKVSGLAIEPYRVERIVGQYESLFLTECSRS